MLAEKDNIIDNLKDDLKGCKTKFQLKNPTRNTSNVCVTRSVVKNIICPVATAGGFNSNVGKSRVAILNSLTGIPSFSIDNVEWLSSVESVGSGKFGDIKLARLKTLNICVPAKILKGHPSTKSIHSEVVIAMTLSGHKHFPFCFGLLSEKIILMEYLGYFVSGVPSTYPTFQQKLLMGIPLIEFKETCKGILAAVRYLHEKNILHNDIKCDNVVIAEQVKNNRFWQSNNSVQPFNL